ncbi:MAG: PAS domain S-box protein [Terriglobales bacterium]
MNELTSIPATYDYRLVTLSVAIAFLASFAGLDLAGRATASRGRVRVAWLIGVAFAMGTGTWLMHYTGMLAYRLPTRVAVASFAILVVTLLFLGFAILTSLVDRRLSTQHLILDDERSMLRALIDNIPDFIYVKDRQGRFVIANTHTARIMGAGSPEELLGKTDLDFYPKELATAFHADEQEMMRSGQSLFNREEKCVDDRGNTTHILTTKVLLRDANGMVSGIAGVGRDISDRKKSDEAVRAAHRAAEVFINAVPSILIGLDHDSRITRWNSAAAGAFGLSRIEVLGKQLTECGVKWLRPEMADEIRSWSSKLGPRRCDDVSFKMNDETRLLGLTITSVQEADGKPAELLVIGSDITARKKSEEALREAERRYREIFDGAIVGMSQSTPDGRLLSVNPAMARICGYDSPEEMIASITDVSRQFYVNPKRSEEAMLAMDKSGGVKNFEYEALRKDGNKIWVTMSSRAVRQNGVVVSYEGMIEDITESKLMRSQLFQAQKLESVGQLAAGIAHEINTPTQYIGDNVRFLKDAFRDLTSLVANYERLLAAAKGNTLSSETVQEIAGAVARADAGYLLEEIPKAIEQTLEGIDRVSKLVGAMKEFSHPDTKEKTLVDLNHSIQCTITVARNEWKYVADMETDFDPSLPPISCQPGEFNQVILNLIVNAAHAIADVVGKGGPAKGKIKVQTRDCPGWAEIRIQDTGTGIPEKARARIFDPFFTTKEIGKGTGQGLAIAHSVVVDKHDGSIHFETEDGKGTTFIIRLPKAAKAVAAGAAST